LLNADASISKTEANFAWPGQEHFEAAGTGGIPVPENGKLERRQTLTSSATKRLVRMVPTLVSEFLIGFTISLAIMICLSGLQLAGLLIDRQSGSFIGAVYDPTLSSHSTATGRFLVLFGLTVFVLMEPVGGHERMIRSLLDSFQSLPPGRAVVTMSTVELLSRLVHESLQLAIQFAAPAIAGASLLAMATAWLGRSFRGGTATVSGYPLRALLNLLILAASLTGAAGAFVDQASGALDRLVFR
jgi:flagellar biosynthetic protein FliR